VEWITGAGGVIPWTGSNCVSDLQRRREAGVPENVVFRTKPELGLEMLRTAVREGLPFQWVGGDRAYGDSPTFVQKVRELGRGYVLGVSSEAHVWLREPEFGKPGPRGGRAEPKSKPVSVAEAVAQLPASAFRRIRVAEGSQGSIVYAYAERRVWFSEDGYPAEKAERLLVRRSLNQDAELKYHRSNAPPKVTLRRLAEQRACRWSIEEDIKACKVQCGLAEYETRGWVRWHHHTALSMLALLFLVLQKLRFKKKSDRGRCRNCGRFFASSSSYAAGTKTKSSNGATGEWSEIASRGNAAEQDAAENCNGVVENAQRRCNTGMSPFSFRAT